MAVVADALETLRQNLNAAQRAVVQAESAQRALQFLSVPEIAAALRTTDAAPRFSCELPHPRGWSNANDSQGHNDAQVYFGKAAQLMWEEIAAKAAELAQADIVAVNNLRISRDGQ